MVDLFKPIGYSITGGLLLNLGFAPYSLWFAPFFALFFLGKALHGVRLLVRLLSVLLFGLSFHLFLLHWSSIYVGGTPWVVLSVAETLLMLPIALIKLSHHLSTAFLFASAWVSVEFVQRSFPFGGFGWGRLGVTQSNAPWLHVLSAGGVPLASFFVALIGVLASLVFTIDTFAVQGLAVLLLAVMVCYATSVLDQKYDRVAMAGSLRLALVQGGVPRLGLDFNADQNKLFEQYRKAITIFLDGKGKGKHYDAIIWPENTVVHTQNDTADQYRTIQNLSTRYRTPFIVGSVTSSDGKILNQSVMIGSKSIDSYSKQHLTPFGEYIPVRSISQSLSPFAKLVTDFSPGLTDAKFELNGVKLAPIICYELLDDQLMKSKIASNEVLLVQTNNATFGKSAELDQELQIAQARAIELHRSVAYVSTTGITSTIEADGTLSKRLRKYRQGVLVSDFPAYSGDTYSVRYGKYQEFLLLGCFLLSMIAKSRRIIRARARRK